MNTFKIELYDLENDNQIKTYESSEVPKCSDEIEFKKNHFLFVEHRIFNTDKPLVKLYGCIDKK